MNRGSAGTDDQAGFQADRFNEAPIHESGKYQLWAEALHIARTLQ